MKIVMMLLSLALCACNNPRRISSEDADAIIRNLRYVKDPKTELCFAIATSATKDGWQVNSIASVPCSALASTGGAR